MRFVAVAVLTLLPLPALASDFGAAFLIFAIGAPLAAIWPLLLPLAFVRGSTSKFRMYAVLVITAFGLLGLAQLPNSLAPIFAIHQPLDRAPGVAISGMAVSHVVAVGASLWVLPRVRRALERMRPAT